MLLLLVLVQVLLGAAVLKLASLSSLTKLSRSQAVAAAAGRMPRSLGM